MAMLGMCRVCLAANVPTHVIAKTELQGMWEKLTNRVFVCGNGKPGAVCFTCHNRLSICVEIRRVAMKSEQLLTEILDNGDKLNQETISVAIKKISKRVECDSNVSDVENVDSVDIGSDCDVKDFEFEVHLEHDQDNIDITPIDYKDVSIIDNFEVSTTDDKSCLSIDNTDTSNLSNSKLKKAVGTKRKGSKINTTTAKKKVKRVISKKIDTEDTDNKVQSTTDKAKSTIGRRPKTRRIKCSLKIQKEIQMRIEKKKIEEKELDVVIEDLTKEEQLEDIAKRKKTSNYIESEFKCELCFKGFLNAKAFENHNKRHSESNGRLECKICHMRWKNLSHLNKHCLVVHQRRYRCNQCDYVSTSVNQATYHKQWHDGKTYDCGICGMSFRIRTTYFSHVRKTHPSENVCNLCGENFLGSLGLALHKAKSHGLRSDLKVDSAENTSASDKFCVECNMEFPSWDAWRRHVLTSTVHRNASSIQCKICHETIPGYDLVTHMKSHGMKPRKPWTRRLMMSQSEGDGKSIELLRTRGYQSLKIRKDFVCETCGKKFKSNYLLVYHQRSHTGEKPFECTVCCKRFRSKMLLQYHMNMHTDVRPYSCKQCDKKFRDHMAVRRHNKVHLGLKPYVCQHCGRTFSHSKSLKNHVMTVHQQEVAKS